MKRIYTSVLLPCAALLLLGSCSVSEKATPDSDLPLHDVTFRAVADEESPATKTVLGEDLGVLWCPGDEINIFYGSDLNKKFTSTNKDNQASVTFTGDLTGISYSAGGKFLALYPYGSDNSSDGSSVTFTLPSAQKSPAASFSRGLFPSMAATTERDLHFKNICGGVRLSFTRDDIVSVSFSGNSGENLCGKVTATMSKDGYPVVQDLGSAGGTISLTPEEGSSFVKDKYYYLVAIPVKLSAGFEITLTVADGNTATRSSSSPVEIKRGVWGTLTGVDSGLTFEAPSPDEDKGGVFGLGGRDMTIVVDKSQLIYSYGEGSLTFTVFYPTTGQFVRVGGIPRSAKVGDSFTVSFLQNIVTDNDASYSTGARAEQGDDPEYMKVVCEDGTVILIKK